MTYVRIRPDNEYWINSETGELVEHWRFEDPERREAGFNGDYPYPAPVPLFSNPAGGGSSKRIPARWWDYVRSINTDAAWNALRRNNGGWINYAANKEWPSGSAVEDNPDPYPKPESITSIGNVHEVIERRNRSKRIKAYKFSDAPPQLGVKDDTMICHFRSIDSNGKLGNAPDGIVSYFPLLVADQAWIPDEKLEFIDELPQEKPIMELDFIDVSHHNGTITWNALRDAEVRGGIAKVSDGYFMPPGYYDTRNHFDPQFRANWAGMTEFDLRGAYHYARFDPASFRPDSLAEQVSKSIDYIGVRKSNDIYVIDVEQPASQIAHVSLDSRADMLIEALQETQTKGWPKKYVWIYTGAWWWDVQMPVAIPPAILEYPVWAASYTAEIRIPNGWEEAIAWQYTDRADILGKKYDGNRFLIDWDAYFDEPGEPPPPEPPIDNEADAILAEMQAVIDKWL